MYVVCELNLTAATKTIIAIIAEADAAASDRKRLPLSGALFFDGEHLTVEITAASDPFRF
ncbi:MAG: hypothetical protein LBL35_08255 [Clostridiales bacterium]|nr:hypothetical protein [Clostridiales bacterium]